MKNTENRIVDSVKRKFSAPLLPFVESISLAESPAQKIIVKYFWEDYALFFITAILAFSLSRLMLFLFPSNVITNALIISMTIIFFILDGYWPTRFSSQFTNKTGYGFSAFYSLPIKPEQLIRQLYVAHFILSGILFLAIVSLFIGYLDIKSVYCLFSIKFIALFIFAGLVTYQELRWLIVSFGLILLGLTFYGYFEPDEIFYQLPLTVLFAFAIYNALVFSFYENRASHKKAPRMAAIRFRDLLLIFGSMLLCLTYFIYHETGKLIYQFPLTILFAFIIYKALVSSFHKNKVAHMETSRIDVINEKDLRLIDGSNSRKSETGYSLFKKGYSSDVMLSRLFLQQNKISFTRIFMSIGILSYIIWNNSPHYLLYIPFLIGVITIPLAWIGRLNNSSSGNDDNFISTLPVSSEKWGNQISLVSFLPSIAFLLVLPICAEYSPICLIGLVWIAPLLKSLEDADRRPIYKYLKLSNSILRNLDWIGYILIPCGVLTLYYGEMIPSFMKAILIIILLSLSLILLSFKAFMLLIMGKWYGAFGRKTQTLFFKTLFIQSLLIYFLVSTYLSANVLSRILQLPISSLSAVLVNLCLSISLGISDRLTIFIDPIGIYFRRHQ
jgi:hypothetical protein